MNWSKTMQDALVGTGQRPLESITPEDPLSHFLALLPAEDRTTQLLLAVGVQELYRTVGRRPATVSADRVWQPAEEDDRPVCSPEITQLVEEILNGHYREMLHPFLDKLCQANRRLPAHLLPNLLSYGARIHRYQPDIIQVIGHRGRWLAELNPKWSYATLDLSNWDDLLRRWRAGKLTDRSRLLSQIRIFKPDLGLQLLENSWPTAENNSRLHLIRQLEAGLSPADEPFLERVLDDRYQPVRRQAGLLLARLPDSRFAQRMATYLIDIVRWNPRSLGERGQLTIAFPKNPPSDMRRDGIPPLQKQRPNFYVKQQLTVIAAAAPLNTWTDHWGVSPQEVVDAVAGSGWSNTLLGALATAANQQPTGGAAWALPLAQASNYSRPTIKLLPLLPEPERDETVAMIVDQFRDEPLKRNMPLKALWRDWPHTWSPAIAKSMSEIFATYIISQENAAAVDLSVRALLTRFLRHVPADMHTEVADWLGPAVETTPLWRGETADGLALLRFRQRLNAAFAALGLDKGPEESDDN